MDLSSFGVEKKDKIHQSIDDKNLNISMNDIKSGINTIDNLERYLPWFVKYKVEKLDDLILTTEIKKIINFVENFKSGKSILLVGSPGSGKTTTINLVAKHYNYELFELNASDARNKKAITESIGDVIKQNSLFGQNKLILIDEVDGVSGRDDRGGVAELAKIVKDSKYPIIFTANEAESDKIKSLKKVATFIDFENHSREVLLGIAKRIFDNEKISYNQKELEDFVDERNTSDIRGFINDLQASVYQSKFIIDSNLEIRDYKKKIEALLDKIYFSYPEDAINSNLNSDINLDDLLLYLEENTPNILKDNSLILAFNEIAKADLFKGRIIKWQYWRFLVYVNFYLTYGVSASKDNVKKVVYKRNQRILKKWMYGNKVNSLRARTKAEKEKGLEEKFVERLAKYYGRSANKTRKEDIFYFIFQYRNDKSFQKEMDIKLNITDDIKKSLLEI